MTKNNNLRKAAILITALDASSADALLEQMPEAYANRVREAVFDLDDVDPDEQQQILTEFLRSTGRPAAAPAAQPHAAAVRSADDTVELVLSSAAESPLTSPRLPAVSVDTYHNPYSAKVNDTPPRPFDFLSRLGGSQLARLLCCEHPQTIAVVTAHLPAERAAELIREFPAGMQAEVLRRVADLSDTDPQSLADLEQELRRSYDAWSRSSNNTPSGVAAVSSILAAAGDTRATLLRNLQQHDARWSGQAGYEFPANQTASLTAADDLWESNWDQVPAAAHSPRDLNSEIEAHRRLARSAQQFGQWQPQLVGEVELPEHAEPTNKSHTPYVEWTFADLDTLSDRDLARVLQSAESDLTMVALAGAEPGFLARLTKQLPPGMARQFSRRIEAIGPLPLRDIEAAQRKIAEIAGDLAEQGVIEQKQLRPFALAA